MDQVCTVFYAGFRWNPVGWRSVTPYPYMQRVDSALYIGKFNSSLSVSLRNGKYKAHNVDAPLWVWHSCDQKILGSSTDNTGTSAGRVIDCTPYHLEHFVIGFWNFVEMFRRIIKVMVPLRWLAAMPFGSIKNRVPERRISMWSGLKGLVLVILERRNYWRES